MIKTKDINVQYDLQIKRSGTPVFEAEIGALELARIIQVVHSANPNSIPQPKASLDETGTLVSDKTSREYLNETKPIFKTQIILALAHFLCELKKTDTVSQEEIKRELENAKEPIPKNFTRDFDRVLKNGWLAKSNVAGKFYITQTGTKIVESGFKVTEGVTSHKNKKRAGGKFSPTPFREEVKAVDLNPSPEGTLAYWGLKTKGKRILWLLKRASDFGFQELNHKEIAFLASEIGDNIPTTAITATTDSFKKKGMLATPLRENTRYLKILQPGIDLLIKK